MNRRDRKGQAVIGLRTLMFLMVLGMPASAAAEQFAGDLDPCPEDNSTRDSKVGGGEILATLSNGILIVRGGFAGFSSPATAAHLNQGLAMGVPGPAIGQIRVAHAMSGDVSARLKLTGAEISALKNGALYIQIDSAKAPNGNSWAWLQKAP
ncbi:MAG: CHRD domain-containing protein [Rhizomicrobium sp.]